MILKQHILFFSLFSLLINWSVAQTNANEEYKDFHMAGDKTYRSGMVLSPDGKTVAVAGAQGNPLFIYDWKTDKIIKKLEVGNWFAGAKVFYSSKATYLLLQQIIAVNFAPNKKRELAFEIVNAATGEVVQKIDKAHAVQIANSELFYIVLRGNEVSLHELPSGKKLNSFIVDNATHSVAISPDENIIAVSHRPTLEQVKNVPTIRNDKKAKKAIKPALKYREMISLYDAKSFQEIKTVNELYDIVYQLQFSKDGKLLYNYSIPHIKMQTASAGKQGYIYAIQMPDGEPTRISFMTLATFEPDFTENESGALFGVMSTDGFPELRIYNNLNGRLLYRFNMRQRLSDAFKKKMMGDNKASFVFLPDGNILMVSGNQTLLWKPQ
ncbi:MAG: hypothetical protein VR77_03670 [Flavobacteriales bacterium BRH_c54]|nr:MAG: hypothetical protein VR77_03670 [Flavobacteriales bacterium BRH_c54]